MQELSAVQTKGCIMSLENTNLSRRNLLRAGALGVPAAGVLAFGSNPREPQPPQTPSPPTAGGAKKRLQVSNGL